MEKLFYFLRVIFAPSPGALSCNVFQAFDSIAVPSTESLDDERRKDDSLRATMVEVRAVLCSLAHLDGGSGKVDGAMDDGVLRPFSEREKQRKQYYKFVRTRKGNDCDDDQNNKKD